MQLFPTAASGYRMPKKDNEQALFHFSILLFPVTTFMCLYNYFPALQRRKEDFFVVSSYQPQFLKRCSHNLRCLLSQVATLFPEPRSSHVDLKSVLASVRLVTAEDELYVMSQSAFRERRRTPRCWWLDPLLHDLASEHIQLSHAVSQ